MKLGVPNQYFVTKTSKELSNSTQAEVDDLIRNNVLKPSIKAPDRGISASFDFEDVFLLTLFKIFKNSLIKRSILMDFMKATKALRTGDPKSSPFSIHYSDKYQHSITLYANEIGAVFCWEASDNSAVDNTDTKIFPIGKKKFDYLSIPNRALMTTKIDLTAINKKLRKKIEELQE